MLSRINKLGFTLIEILFVISILSIVMISLYKVSETGLFSISQMNEKEELLAHARNVMDNISKIVQETDDILSPTADGSNSTTLKVSERVLDTYNNITHAYTINGDGILDADNNCDGYVNKNDVNGSDPKEYVELTLNGDILSIRYPDYSTADTTDSTAYETFCENVTFFECNRLANNLIEIKLALNIGKNEIDLKTRVLARNTASGGGDPSNDTSPPEPDPMTWDIIPTSTGYSSIKMSATTASDLNGVEYYFDCVDGGGHDSGWQDGDTYEDTGLAPETIYTYCVKARDKSSNQNETSWSINVLTTTDVCEIYVYDIDMSYRLKDGLYHGRATIWIKDDTSVNIKDAKVYGFWSGCDYETKDAITGEDGKVMIESHDKRYWCTWKFTVTDVVKSGCTYTPGLNLETDDSIWVPPF